MVNQIQILKNDPAYPFLDMLRQREDKNIVEIADTLFNFVYTLHKTSTPIRPALNGISRKVAAESLGVSKGLISQYLSIHNITSKKVRQEIIQKKIGIIRAYYVSKARGKNQEETEKVQLQKIDEIIRYRKKNDISKLIRIKEVKYDTTRKNILSEQHILTTPPGDSTLNQVFREREGVPNKSPSIDLGEVALV